MMMARFYLIVGGLLAAFFSRVRWPLLGLVLVFTGTATAGQKAGPIVKPVTKLIVHDATGKKVGEVQDSSYPGGTAFVPVSINGSVYVLSLTGPNELGGDSTATFRYYQSQDCSGVAWLPVGGPYVQTWPFPQTVILTPGRTLYEVLPARAEEPPVNSQISNDGLCSTVGARDYPIRWLAPTKPLVDLSTVFTPPYSIKAKP